MTKDEGRKAAAQGHSSFAVRGSSSLTRRRSLQVAVSASGAVAFTGCEVGLPQTPLHEFVAQSRVNVAEETVSAYEDWYATACRGCSAGCGTIVRVIEGRSRKVEGNPDHPLNQGKLCARGQASVQEQYHPDRLRGPQRLAGGPEARGAGRFAATTWDSVLQEVGGRLRDLVQSGRGGRVVLVTPPLSATRALIADGFTRALGAQWLVLDTFSEAPLRAAARVLLGQDRLPSFDLKNARFVLSFGADFLGGGWLSPVRYEREYGEFRQGRYGVRDFAPRQGRPRGTLVHVSPRFSATAANADEWLPIKPGTEGLLALSLAQVIQADGLADPAGARLFGDAAALAPYTPERVAAATGVEAGRIRQLARAFAAQRPALAIGGGAAGAHPYGAEALTAVLALNALTGSLASAGAAATGGIQAAPAPPVGLPAPAAPAPLAAWQQLAAQLNAGQVDVVVTWDANPVHALPERLGLRDALVKAPLLLSMSSLLDDTSALADYVLATHLPLEDWGDAVVETGDAPAYTVQQPVVPPLYNTQSAGDVLLALAGQIGGLVAAALPWPSMKDAVRDTARQLQQLNRGSVREPDFERFWTRLLQQGGWWDQSGGSSAPPPAPDPAAVQRAIARIAPPAAGADAAYPYALALFPHHALGTGGGAHLPWLQALPDPITSAVWQTWVEVNPGVARKLGLREGEVVRVESPFGQVEALVYVSPAAPPDVLALPLGQGHRAMGRWAEGRGSNPVDLLAPLGDATSGALAYGATRVRLVTTGRRRALPKLEGSVPAYQLPGEEQKIIKLTRRA